MSGITDAELAALGAGWRRHSVDGLPIVRGDQVAWRGVRLWALSEAVSVQAIRHGTVSSVVNHGFIVTVDGVEGALDERSVLAVKDSFVDAAVAS